MAGRRQGNPLAILVTSAALIVLVTALVLSLLSGGDDAESSVITLDPDGGTVPQVDLTGHPAPEVTFEDLASGDDTDLVSVRAGRPMVVNFFAKWCPPCVEEMPGLEDVHQDLGDRVAFLGISEREAADDAQALVDQTGVTYAIGRDPSGDVITAFSGVGMPTTVLIAADGTITSSHTGRITPEELRQRIQDELLS